MNLDFSFPK